MSEFIQNQPNLIPTDSIPAWLRDASLNRDIQYEELDPNVPSVIEPGYAMYTMPHDVDPKSGISQYPICEIFSDGISYGVNAVKYNGVVVGYALTVPDRTLEEAYLVSFLANGSGEHIVSNAENSDDTPGTGFSIIVNPSGEICFKTVGENSYIAPAQSHISADKRREGRTNDTDNFQFTRGTSWVVGPDEVLKIAEELQSKYENNIPIHHDGSPESTAMLYCEASESFPDIMAEISKLNLYFKFDTVDGRPYAISEVFQHSGKQRLFAILLITDKNGVVYPRYFYKSYSEGGWRSCPGFNSKTKLYNKGHCKDGGGYVWETKPSESMIGVLEELPHANPKVLDGTVVDDIFEITRLKSAGIYTCDTEIIPFSIDSESNEGIYSLYEAGIGLTDVDSADQLEGVELEEGFMPDFSKVLREYSFEHAILGDTRVTVHEATLDGRKVEWHMATAAKHNWVDRIVFIPVETNSYGVSSELILGGALAMKPLEYSHQCTNMISGRDTAPARNGYVSLKPLLDRLPWIKQYKINYNSKIA